MVCSLSHGYWNNMTWFMVALFCHRFSWVYYVSFVAFCYFQQFSSVFPCSPSFPVAPCIPVPTASSGSSVFISGMRVWGPRSIPLQVLQCA